jgi:hypothetical protein
MEEEACGRRLPIDAVLTGWYLYKSTTTKKLQRAAAAAAASCIGRLRRRSLLAAT